MKSATKPELTRRGLFGALAGVAAVVTSLVGKRLRDPKANPRRRGFWIGHT